MSDDLISKIEDIVDVEFCEKVLRSSENKNDLKVTDVIIKRATTKGDNYTSDMFRVTVKYLDKKVAKKCSIIVKFQPIADGIHKDLISKSSLFLTEIMMMTDTLAKMNKILGEENPLNGRGLYTQKEDPILLVIEDLSPYGYRMADRQAGLNVEHCLLAIRGLARFHASSVALFEKEPEQCTRYTQGMFNAQQPREMHAFFIAGAKQLGQEVATWPEIDSRISDKIIKFAENIYQKGIEVSAFYEDQFNVINHGDFWVNNMLFKYDEDGRPIKHIFVDFQLCLYSSPAIDLQYFFNTSLSDETLIANEEMLLEEYTKTLARTMSETGCQTEPPSLEDVKRMLLERAMYGMIASFTILPILLVNKAEAKTLDEMMGEGGVYDNPGYKGELYRKAMIRRLPKFEDMGLLD